MNRLKIIVLAILAASLGACVAGCRSSSTFGTQQANVSTSEPQITILRAKLNKLHFPQPAGTVQRLLPPQARQKSTTIGDRFPNEAGLLAVYHRRYALSPEWDLVLHQGHYSTFFGTKIRDDGAQIVRPSDF